MQNISVVGAGGVGGYFGARIARAGFKVDFIARGEHLKAMQKNGLVIKSILGDFTLNKVNACGHFENVKNADLIILGVKAWQVKEVALAIKPFIKTDAVVLPLQNGVMATTELTRILDEKYVLSGLCRIISKIETPGVISHFGVDPAIVFGEADSTVTKRILAIKKIFDQSGINHKVSENIQADLWKKFINICVSGLLAVTHTTYGELRSVPQTRQMMTDLFQEVYDLSQKEGVDIQPDYVDKMVAFIDSFPPHTTSSLTRDVWEGKPSEIEYQNGTVVKLARKKQLPVPVNEFVYNCILPMEMKARGLLQNHQIIK
ncbi:MAG: ketopantoate reductase family protein [Bacteroidota bacterium]